MALIDLDNEFLKMFYDITETPAPLTPTLDDLKKQLKKVVETLNNLNVNVKKQATFKLANKSEESAEDEPSGPAILVVDDLGVITYQLKVLLSQFNMDIDCSQEIYDAVNKYKKRRYTYIVMDLFIPTEREGFILLTELRKLASANGDKILIGVITASPRKEIEMQCKARGADFFLEKNNDWQNQLIKIMGEYINADKDEEDIW